MLHGILCSESTRKYMKPSASFKLVLWTWEVWHRLLAPLTIFDPKCWVIEIPIQLLRFTSDPRSIPYCSPNSVLTILWDSDTMLPFPQTPTNPWDLWHYHHPPRPPNDLQDPQPHFCLHYSVLVFLHSILVFTSPSQSLSFCFWYIAPFQYSCSLILASALPCTLVLAYH